MEERFRPDLSAVTANAEKRDEEDAGPPKAHTATPAEAAASQLRKFGATLRCEKGTPTGATLLFSNSASGEALAKLATAEHVVVGTGENINYSEIQQLQKLLKLKTLSLNHCSNLTDVSTTHLAKINTLQKLTIIKTRL